MNLQQVQGEDCAGNDVNMGVLGEKWLGAARDCDDVVGMFMGTGLGGGVILNGKLETGFWGRAGELGPHDHAGGWPKCTCGNKGCLEAFVGRWAIERDIRQAVRNGEKTVITELAGARISRVKSKALKGALAKKDPVVTRVMRSVSEVMGQPAYHCVISSTRRRSCWEEASWRRVVISFFPSSGK